MMLVLQKGISEERKNAIISQLREEGYMIKDMSGVEESVLGVVGTLKRDLRYFENQPGVTQVIPISKPYKLVSRQLQPQSSVVRVGDVEIGGGRLVVIAGPCGVEGRDITMKTARQVRKSGAVLFRGGAFKPRTSPYSFQGLGEEGLKILAEVREETGMGVVTEMTSPSQADLMVKYVDVVQIGARNMQNFELLKTAGRMGKPVLLKRGLAATIKDWLMAAEYILSEGNDQVILCERGIRTFETHTRNTLDISAVPVIKELTHLPIIVDPSHATGIRSKVSPMARAAVAAGADGLIIEVHSDPDKALSDGPQSLYPEQFEQLMRNLYVIAPVVDKQLDFAYLDKAAEMRKNGKPRQAKTEVVFHGAPGTASHKACSQFFGTVDCESRGSFGEIFSAVTTGEARLGVVPLENSITGSLHENYDLLLAHDLKIVGEVTLRVVNNLIGWEGTDLDQIKRVYSHPSVFDQCKDFLSQHPEWDLIASKNSASNVKRIKENQDPSEAAISSQEAADMFQMAVLKESIESNPRNFTRFVILSKSDFPGEPRNKTSQIFSVPDRPGALFKVMEAFAQKEVNILKLESRPIPDQPWAHMFYIDFELDQNDPRYAEIMEHMKANTSYYKCLGTYPRGADDRV